MATIFARRYARASWNPDEWLGPCPDFTLREWEASVVLCSLSPALRLALIDRLSEPSARRWPPEHAACRQAETLLDLFHDEIDAIFQTIETPLAALHGIARDTRLVAHGARLRQLVAALGEARALHEIEALTRPTRQWRYQQAPRLRERWGGRWAWFFAGDAASA
jgi:hypothetical protein